MFGLFGKKTKEAREAPEGYVAPDIASPYGAFTIQPWCGDDAVNGNHFAKKARAHGRYEVAEAFHRVGTQYYGDNIVNNCDPSNNFTEEMLQGFAEGHQEMLAYITEFSLLTATRERLVAALASHPAGIQRDKLKAEVAHEGTTKWGVICNQLAKGGFIRQEDKVLYPADVKPMTNEEFLAQEIPAPSTSGLGFNL